MAERVRLTSWHISRFPAMATRGAYVVLRGRQARFTKTLIISETLHVPLDITDVHVHPNKEIIERAKEMSQQYHWVGNV